MRAVKSVINKLKSKKGLTLIELVVGLIIFGIITLTISMILTPTLFAYMRANDFAEYNALLDNIANQMINDLSQATAELDNPPTGPWVDDVTIRTFARNVRYWVTENDPDFNDGVLMIEGVNAAGVKTSFPVFAEDFFKRKAVNFEISVDATSTFTSYILELTITGTDGQGQGNDGFSISRSYAVRPLMLS